MANNFVVVIKFDNAARDYLETMRVLREPLMDLGGVEEPVRPGWDWKFGPFATKARIRQWKFPDQGSRDSAKALVDSTWGSGGDAPVYVDPLPIVNLHETDGVVVSSGTYYPGQILNVFSVPRVYASGTNTLLAEYTFLSTDYTDGPAATDPSQDVVMLNFVNYGDPEALTIPLNSITLKDQGGTEYALEFSQLAIDSITTSPNIELTVAVGSDLKLYPVFGTLGTYPDWASSNAAGAI